MEVWHRGLYRCWSGDSWGNRVLSMSEDDKTVSELCDAKLLKSLFSNLKANLWWFDSAQKSSHTQLHLFWEFLLLRKTVPTKGVTHKVCTAKIIHSHLPSTVKKCTLNPKALLDVLIQNFLIALYSSFFYRILIHFWSCAAIVNIFYNKGNRTFFSFSVFTFISICLASFIFSVSRKVRAFSVSLCNLHSTSNQFLFQNSVNMKTKQGWKVN